jgi:nicotinamidase-related amidase
MAANALVIIDMQMDMQHRMEAGRDHVDPKAPERIADLVAAFRRKGLPVLHIRHADENPVSPFHPEARVVTPT